MAAALPGTKAEVRRAARPRARIRALLTHAVLLVLGFFYLFPFLWMLGASLKTAPEFFERGLSLLPQQWQWQNYTLAWTVAKFGSYFGNTLFVTVWVVGLTNLLASMAGFAIARTQFLGRRLVVGLIVATFFLPRGYTIVPVYEIIRALHLNNTLWAVILVSVGSGLMFNAFLFMGYFQTLPREIEEAAIIDGTNQPQLYWYVMLPLAGPMLATVTLLTFIGTWNDFFTPLVFTLGKPELRTLAVGMFAFVGENSRDWTLMCAGAVISIAPIIIVFLFLQRYFIEGIAGAVK